MSVAKRPAFGETSASCIVRALPACLRAMWAAGAVFRPCDAGELKYRLNPRTLPAELLSHCTGVLLSKGSSSVRAPAWKDERPRRQPHVVNTAAAANTSVCLEPLIALRRFAQVRSCQKNGGAGVELERRPAMPFEQRMVHRVDFSPPFFSQFFFRAKVPVSPTNPYCACGAESWRGLGRLHFPLPLFLALRSDRRPHSSRYQSLAPCSKLHFNRL